MAPPAVLLIVPILASLLLLLTCHRVDAECEPATCGNLTVKYPFWLGAAGQSPPNPCCGPPNFELWCAGNGTNTTAASMRGSSIHVLSIDYAAGTFVASHTRVATGDAGVCGTDFNMSSSLALSPFKISATNRALCFLYSCNGTEPRGPEFVNATAVGCGRDIYAYLGGSYDRDTPPVIAAGKCTYSYLPVLASGAETEGEGETAAEYGRMLRDGFLLEWGGAGGIGDCEACGRSGGECRYSNASDAFACLCPGGRLRGSRCDGECHDATCIIQYRHSQHLQTADVMNRHFLGTCLFDYLGFVRFIASSRHWHIVGAVLCPEHRLLLGDKLVLSLTSFF
jgi:hypothetical protein